jgi:hypothetical protein
LSRKADATYYTAPVLLASIVEINVGIVVGCMPVIQTTILSHFSKAWRISSACSLILRLFLNLRASTRAATCSEHHQNEKRSGKFYLEAEILHGADGEGRFMTSMESSTGTQRSWLQRSRTRLGTWTSRWNKGSNTATDYQLSNSSIMITTSISSDIHSSTRGDRDLHKHYMLQGERVPNIV